MNAAESKVKAEGKAKKEQATHSARERCEAVLAVWMERRRPAQVCRKLSISEGILLNWQDRALRGMLEALEPRTKIGDSEGPWLPSKLVKKLGRQAAQREARQTKLARRLEKIGAGKEIIETA